MPLPTTYLPHRILVVDFSGTLTTLVYTLLAQAELSPWQCETAGSEAEFREQLQEHSWSLVLCEYRDSQEQTEHYLELSRKYRMQVPFMVVAGEATIQNAVQAMQCGAWDFIEKSNEQHLLARICQTLEPDRAQNAKAEARLSPVKSAAQHLALILNTMHDAIMSISLPDRRLLFVSAAFEKVFGYPPQRFIDDPQFFSQVTYPDDLSLAVNSRVTVLKEGFVSLDHRIIWPDGQVRWIHRRAWVNYDSQHNPIEVIDTAQDITNRKRVEEELRAVTRKQRALLRTIPDLIFHVDSSGTLLDYHGADEDSLLGAEHLVGRKIHEFINAPFAPRSVIMQVLEALDYVKQTRQVTKFDYVMPDNRQYTAQIVPIEESDEMIIIAHDITEQRQTEASLRENDEWKRLTLDASELGIWRLDMQLNIMHLDSLAQRHFGINTNAMPVSELFQRIYPDDFDRVQAEIAISTKSNAGGRFFTEYRTLHSDGSVHWLVIRAKVDFREVDGINQPWMTFGTTQDVTNEKHMQETLRYHASMMQQISDAIIAFDTNSCITIWNRGAVEMYGWTEAEALGKPIDSLLQTTWGDFSPDQIRQTILQTGYWHGVLDQISKQGRAMNIAARVSLLKDAHGQFIGGITVNRDITERNATEVALRRSEAYLRSLVNSETAFNIRVDMQGQISYCNERYRREFAWAAPSLVGMSPMEVVHPDDRSKVVSAVTACMSQSGKAVQIEIRKGTQTGGYIWTLWEFSAVTGADGAVQEIHCVGFEITRQKQAEAALQEANQLLEQRIQERTAELEEERNLLRTLIDSVPDFIYVKDRQHRIVLNNIAHRRSVGKVSNVEVIGKTDHELFSSNMAAKFYEDEERIFETGHGIINVEEKSLGIDGSEIWALTTKVPLRSLRGQVIGLVGITRDITAMKAAGEALLSSQERYRKTIAAMSEGVVVQGVNGTIQLCNQAAERILGLTNDQLLGRTSVDPRWKAIHEDGTDFPGTEHPSMVTLRTGEAQIGVIMGVHKPENTVTWILINSQPLIDPVDQQMYAVVATFTDITSQKLAETAIKKALAKEKVLSELRSRFVSMASHEFRTPLASILAATETLLVYRSRMDEAKIEERLNRIRSQVSHMTDIIEDVLQLSKMQAGRSKFEPSFGDVDALCRVILSDLADQSSHERVLYECPQTPVMLNFDERLLRHVVSNLVQNALKYSPSDKQVSLRLHDEPDGITLQVKDSGIGIPPEDLDHLFEPFHRAGNVGAISGTGLGLAIAKEAVELHGGTIVVESEVGEGTTFTVAVPKARSRITGEHKSTQKLV